MASPTAVLSVLVEADTQTATTKLTAYQAQLDKANVAAKKGIETRLGANYDPRAFAAYEQATRKAMERTANRAAFKAELGANFSPGGFKAYQRAIDQQSRDTQRAEKNNRNLTASFKDLATGVLGTVAAFEAYKIAKEAIDDTVELGHATEKLTAITGMDTKTASTWIEAMRVRGVQSQAVSMGFITLERNMRNAEDGSKAAVKAFQQLGISQQSLKNDSVQQMVLQTADALEHVEDPANRAALAQQLFGRNAKALLPVLSEGSTGVKDLLDQTQKYGAFLPDHVGAINKAVEAQHQMKLAMEGLRLTIGTRLIPLMLPLVRSFLNFIVQMRQGTGLGGQFARAIKNVVNVIKDAVTFLIRLAGGMKNLLTVVQVLTAAFIALKVAMAAAALYEAIQPWMLIVMAIAVAALLIVKNWKPIKAFFINLWNAVRTDAQPVVQWLTNAWQNAANAITTAWQAVSTFLTNVFNTLASIVKPVIDAFIKGFQSLVPVIGPAIDTIGGIISTFIQILQPVIDMVGIALPAAFNAAKDIIGGVMSVIGTVISTGWNIATDAFNAALGTIKTVMSAIGGVISGAFKIIKGVIEVFTGLFTLDFSKMWDGIKSIFSGAVQVLVSIVRGIWGAMKGAAEFIMNGLKDGISGVWAIIKTVFHTAIGAVLDVITGAWNLFWSAGKFVIGGIESGIKGAVSAVLGVIVGFINDIIDVINFFITKIGLGKIGHVTNPMGGGGGGGSSSTPPASASQPGHHATGGLVTTPGYFAGEEAPQHPEFILATNPKYRARNLELFQQAGAALGVPGFATGGRYSVNDMANLWLSVGGPANVAHLMGAIGMAESGGDPGIVNSIGASGLWQIHPPEPGDLDPATNARIAVRKYLTQGLGAWQAYTNGSYRQFLGGGGGGGGGGGLLDVIGGVISSVIGGGIGAIMSLLPKPPKLPDWISGLPGFLLDKAANFITTSIFGGRAPTGGGPAAAGTTPYDGHPVANWIVPILNWARTHGWGGSVTSGYRTPAEQMAAARSYGLEHYGPAGPLGSNHIRTAYPGGAVDVTDPAQLAGILASYRGTPTLVWGGPVMGDTVHFSATGHRTGGIYGRIAGMFGNGGVVNANSPTMAVFGENGPETAIFIPGYAGGGGWSYHPGPSHPATRPRPATRGGSGWGYAPGPLNTVTMPQRPVRPGSGWAYAPGPLNTVYTPPQHTGAGGGGGGGATAAPNYSIPNVEPGVPHLPGQTPATAAGAAGVARTIHGTRDAIARLEHQYSFLSQFFDQQPEDLVNQDTGEVNHAAVNRRLDQLAQLIAIRQKIFRAWGQVVALTQRLINSNREIIKRLKKALAGISLKGLKGDALKAAQGRQTSLKTAISKYQGNLTSALGDLQSASDDRDSAWLALRQDLITRASVAGTQPTTSTAGGTTTTGGAAATTTAEDPRVALLQTLLTRSRQATAVSQAQYAVLQNFPAMGGAPPYGGQFQSGGVVPGPVGAARTIIAHGGETITPHGAGLQVHVHIANGMDWLRDLIQVEISQSGRRDARHASRQLPGGR